MYLPRQIVVRTVVRHFAGMCKLPNKSIIQKGIPMKDLIIGGRGRRGRTAAKLRKLGLEAANLVVRELGACHISGAYQWNIK